MAHPIKGSPEAKAWAAKMQAARKKHGSRRRKKNSGETLYVDPVPIPGKKWPYQAILKSADGDVPMFYKSLQEAKVDGKKFGYKVMLTNPGEAWHEREAGHAHDVVRRTDDPDEKVFYAGVESAHRISASAAKKLKMNPKSLQTYRVYDRTRERRIPYKRRKPYAERRGPMLRGLTPGRGRRAKKNPLAVFGFGNPPKRVSVGVAGVLYSRCLEIRAEKLKYKPGLYKHPFARKAGVQILALDSGDLLVHSTRKVNLWKPA